ncbi:MAG: glycosyltransferase family 2 protein [Bacteroidales bacterium]|nr:glycosyltransferase family 2 protein [Bacteroidales bacterium]
MIRTSIVILNWNGRKFLEKFLGDVIKYSDPGNCRIYVADNGSTDDSCEFIRANHPGVEVMELGQNYGFAGGYNEALKRIDSRYFVLLNSDIEVSPGWLEPVISYMEDRPDVAACQPKILSYHERHKFEYAGAAGGFLDKYGYPFCRGRILDLTEEDQGQYNDIKQIFWASGACMFIRSSDWKESGGFDPDFFTHMEEIDLCWRLNASGRKIVYIPASVVYHIGGGTLSYSSPRKVYFNFRNNLFLLYKNLPPGKMKKTLFIRKCLDGVAALRFLFTLQIPAFIKVLKAHMHFYGHRAALREKRMKEQERGMIYPEDLILNKSLVFDFYIRKKRTYTQIMQG